MRINRILPAAAAIVAIAAPAWASSDWDVNLSAAPQGPVRVDEVRLGDKLAAHVDDIGQRDLDRLLVELREEVEERLAARGLLAGPGEAAVELDLTLVEAVPNRPTFAQLSGRGDWNWDEPGVRPRSRYLSLSSFGLGSTELVGSFTAPGGAELGEVVYRYEERSLEQAQYAATWTDVHRGIDIFAGRVAETVTD